MNDHTSQPPKPFGTVLGHAPGGVPAYSSDYETVDSVELPDRKAFRHEVGGVYTGYKWQCVEFARRWLLLNKGYVFDDIAMAYDIFRLSTVKVVKDGTILPLKSFRNGSQRRPEPGCMLIWSEGGTFEVTGHVAIVTEVSDRWVRVAEQNVVHHAWEPGADYARELPATVGEDGSYWIRCSFHDGEILGWVMQTDDDTHAEHFEAASPKLFNVLMKRAKRNGQHLKEWLNLANPDEAAFVEMMRGHRLTNVDKDLYKYFLVSETAEAELKRATNELHAMLMHATNYVLQDDARLEKFNIPSVLWPKIHRSWDNRRNQMITGRFDFCMTERGLKLYEYNCDSAACHMECGKVQGAWARHFGVRIGTDPGEDLQERLAEAWHDSGVDQPIHIMIDRELEETYHALFLRSTMEAGGLSCRLVRGLEGLHWDDEGNVRDAAGGPIRWIWKTWAWETALDQLRKEEDEDAQHAILHARMHTGSPRLMDVLFHPRTIVFEPLWTLVTSNKAILPVLWQMFPENRYLLDTSYELTPSLQSRGYVSKPIAGRRGHNITIVDQNADVIEGTTGRFDDQDLIYQELSPLPKLGDRYVQLCTFSVMGTYGGACIRTDPSPIIVADSDLLPLRMVSDEEFLRLSR